MWIDITDKEKKDFNALATHPLQTYEWGEFRKATGVQVIRRGLKKNNQLVEAFQMTLHPIPHTPWNIGYVPKGTIPTRSLLDELLRLGKEKHCVFIQIEPNVKTISNFKSQISNLPMRPAAHPLFTKYTFELDLTKSEADLLLAMHPKTRYNIRVAQKHHVYVEEDSSPEGFQTYWKLLAETTKRQGFYAHTKDYHQKMFEILVRSQRTENGRQTRENKGHNDLEAHLFLAKYTPPSAISHTPLTLAAWVIFSFHDHLYYPYGASSNLYRNVMASQAMMWHVIQFGKKEKLRVFDMWGSLGENPDVKDPWYGFHRLKQGFGPELVEFAGSFDVVIQPLLYILFTIADKLRWILLRFTK